MTKLIFTDHDHAGRVYPLVLEKTTVGRAAGNTLVISDASLSAAHCEILVNGAEVIVRDLGSRNGTFVNGAKLVNQQSQLKAGQTVRFGSVEARLELDKPSTDDTASEMTAVHAMGRIMREQKKEREKPKPTDASMKLDSPGSSQNEDRTVTDYTAPQPRPIVDRTSPPSGTNSPETSSSKAVIVILVVLIVGLAVLLWLWWGRK